MLFRHPVCMQHPFHDSGAGKLKWRRERTQFSSYFWNTACTSILGIGGGRGAGGGRGVFSRQAIYVASYSGARYSKLDEVSRERGDFKTPSVLHALCKLNPKQASQNPKPDLLLYPHTLYQVQ